MVRHTLTVLQHLLQDFLSAFDHFGTLCIKGLKGVNDYVHAWTPLLRSVYARNEYLCLPQFQYLFVDNLHWTSTLLLIYLFTLIELFNSFLQLTLSPLSTSFYVKDFHLNFLSPNIGRRKVNTERNHGEQFRTDSVRILFRLFLMLFQCLFFTNSDVHFILVFWLPLCFCH